MTHDCRRLHDVVVVIIGVAFAAISSWSEMIAIGNYKVYISHHDASQHFALPLRRQHLSHRLSINSRQDLSARQ